VLHAAARAARSGRAGRGIADKSSAVGVAAVAVVLYLGGVLWVRALLRSSLRHAAQAVGEPPADLPVALDQLALHLHAGRSLAQLVDAAEQAGVAASRVLNAWRCKE
jgi:Flp pilus assembly protein TadB